MKRLRGLVGILALMALLALVTACGTTTVTGVAARATPTATLIPPPTPVPTIANNLVSACFGSQVSPSQVTQSGDFLFTPVTVDGLAYPAVMLPDGTPTNKPYKLSQSGPAAYSSDFPNSPVTNPALKETGGGGFQLSVCDTSTTQAHVLHAVSAKITRFTAYSGQLSSWQACDGTMDSHHNLSGGGCGGGVAGCDCFHAVFPTAAIGTVVSMTQTDSSLVNPGDNLGKLPFTLKPDKSVTLSLGMDTPPVGEYTFAFGLTFDASSPIYSTNSPNTLLAPTAHTWGGLACQQPSLKAQITPTNPGRTISAPNRDATIPPE